MYAYSTVCIKVHMQWHPYNLEAISIDDFHELVSQP